MSWILIPLTLSYLSTVIEAHGPSDLPVIRVQATDSIYSAGYSHGSQAKELIMGFLNITELLNLKQFTFETTAGYTAFENFKRDNSQAFPRFVEEMQGISDGAGIPMADIWMINMLQELENLERLANPERIQSDHCTDVMASTEKWGIWHGHNEDWSEDVKEFMYVVVYAHPTTHNKEPNFHQCTGFVYPGMIPGSALSFNPEGIIYTQNSMFPTYSRNYGLLSNFVNRLACEQTTWQGVVEALNTTGQAMGFSLNVVSVRQQVAMNVEVYEDSIAVTFANDFGNISHVNKYKWVDPLPYMPVRNSSLHRQSRMDALPPVRSPLDVRRVLGDFADYEYPIYRYITLMTSLVNGLTGDIFIWVNSNPYSTNSTYIWNYETFWNL